MPEKLPSKDYRNFYLPYLIGGALGALFGWILAPQGYQRLGLGIGGSLGILLGSLWRWWWLKRRYQDEVTYKVGPSGHIIYAIFTGLMIYMLWRILIFWTGNPQKWFMVLVGFLFFGACTMVVLTQWWFETRVVSDKPLAEAKRQMLFSLSCFIIAITGVVAIFWGNLIIGVATALFSSWGGVALLRKARSQVRS